MRGTTGIGAGNGEIGAGSGEIVAESGEIGAESGAAIGDQPSLLPGSRLKNFSYLPSIPL